jgi:hypothetical protein
MALKPKFVNPERATLVKALHTATTVPRLAYYLIKSDKFPVTNPKAAVRKALEIIGHRSDWDDDDPQFAKCVRVTVELIQQ